MSGHGRFSVIGGGNRPLPIELPKVEDLKPGGDTLGALNVDGVSKDGPAVADTRLDQANRVSAKLDTMLLKAAKTVVKPVDAKALKATTAGLPKASRKAIDKAAAKAETAFQTISKFSGRQIAAAMAKNGDGCFEWDGRNPAGKAIKAALDALAALSEKLVKAINELPKDAPAAVQAALDEAVLRNDRRASEIQTLFCDFADMAEKAFDDPANVERLGKTLASFLPAQSMKMHDSAKIAADFRVSLAPLARRIDELAAGKERQLSNGEAASIRRQIDEAANALAKADSRLGFHSEAEAHQYHPAKLEWRLGELAGTKARLAEIDAALACGERYPESAFERAAPVCRLGGGWTDAAGGVRFRADETGGGDLALELDLPRGARVRVNTLDAAGVTWYRSVSVDETGARPYEFSNAVPPAHEVAECRVEAGKERAQVRFVLSSDGWDGRSDRRPEWLQVMNDGATERIPDPNAPLWPERKLPKGDWRLNLDPLRGRLFGRLLGWRARACAEKAL